MFGVKPASVCSLILPALMEVVLRVTLCAGSWGHRAPPSRSPGEWTHGEPPPAQVCLTHLCTLPASHGTQHTAGAHCGQQGSVVSGIWTLLSRSLSTSVLCDSEHATSSPRDSVSSCVGWVSHHGGLREIKELICEQSLAHAEHSASYIQQLE